MTLQHPDPDGPAAAGRPLRRGPVQGAARAARRARRDRARLPRHLPPAGAGARRRWGGCGAGCATLFSLPDGYEVVLGNGGATEFWDIATFGLISAKSQHLYVRRVLARSSPTAAAQAPFLDEPSVVKSEPGTHPLPVAEAGVDLYALTHNETSTGVMMPIAGSRAPTTARWSPSTRRAVRAACRSRRRSSTSTTSRRRSASPPTAACGSRSCRRPPSSGSPRSRRPAAGCRRRTT